VAHRIFKQTAPNVALTFSVFIPNDADEGTRSRSLHLIARYLPYVAGHADMFTAPSTPQPCEVAGLLQYADLVADYGKPFGIDELGCWDEETFREVMGAVTSGQLGDLRFLNFFDYHVCKPGIDNPWHLKDADKRLLRDLKQRGRLATSRSAGPP